MKLKRLFQVLVLGGSTLVALSACGSDSSNPPPGGGGTPPPQSLLPDGGTPPPGYNGPLIW
jgi:hypothetical protein